MLSIKIIRDGKNHNITKLVGEIQITDSVDQLGMDLTISYHHSFTDVRFKADLYNGDLIYVYNDKDEIFGGIITETPINGDGYTGHDFAFYLNKSKCVVQFKKVSADDAIKKLLNRYDVPIGSIPKMPTKITKVYKDKYIGDVIKDILKLVRHETGKHNRIEMKKGKLCITNYETIKLKPTYMDELGNTISCTNTVNITGTRSIEDLKNKVVVCGNSEKTTQVKSVVKSSKSIRKYGLLTEVITKDKLTEANARNTAKNELKDLNKVATNFTAEMVGNWSVKSGRQLYFERPEVRIKGWYKIKSCTHIVKAGMHTMECEMERI